MKKRLVLGLMALSISSGLSMLGKSGQPEPFADVLQSCPIDCCENGPEDCEPRCCGNNEMCCE